MTESTPDDVAAQRSRVMEELRGYGATVTEFSRRFANWLGLHYTALTSGATTALINRRELAQHAVRTREHSDRRIVTLHATEHVAELAGEYFGPLSTRLDAVMAKYPPGQLRKFETFMVDLRNTMEAHLREQNSER